MARLLAVATIAFAMLAAFAWFFRYDVVALSDNKIAIFDRWRRCAIVATAGVFVPQEMERLTYSVIQPWFRTAGEVWCERTYDELRNEPSDATSTRE